MATSTTNYSFSLPEVGGDTDQWGTQLNANWTLADSTLKTIEDSVVDVTLTGNNYLTISGQAITVGDVDLTTDVTGTLPVASGGTGLAALGSANQVLAVNSTADGLEFQTISGSGTVTSVGLTGANGISFTGSPITTSGTISTAVDAATLKNHLAIDWADVANKPGIPVVGTDAQAYDAGLTDIAALAVTDGNFIVGDGTNWVVESGATARTSLGLGTAATSNTSAFESAGSVSTHAAATSSVHGISAFGATLVDDADAPAARTTLGLGTAATTAATNYATAAQGTLASTALQDVVDDSAPQLGGNLDVATFSIVSSSAQDINITPDSTGNVVLGNFSFDADQTVGLSEDNYILTYNNTSGLISLEAASVTESQISDFGSYQPADQALTDISGLAVTDGNIIVGNGTTWVAESGATARTSLGLTIGTDVQAYDANTAKYNDTTANFTGTLQNGGSDVLVATDIGSSVQAAGSYLTSVDLASDVGSTVLPVANGGTGITAGGSDRDILAWDSANTQWISTKDLSSGTYYFATARAKYFRIEDSLSPPTDEKYSYLRSIGGVIKFQTLTDAGSTGSSIFEVTRTGTTVDTFDFTVTPSVNGVDLLSGTVSVANGGTGLTSLGAAGQVLKVNSSATALEFADESGGGGSGSSYIEHSSTVSDSLAISSGTNRMYIGNTTFSGSGTMAGYLVISHGYANFTGASALNVTGTLRIVG